MKRELLKILACPICKSYPLKLKVTKKVGSEIVEGILTCPKCNRWYPIHNEIPELLPDELREDICTDAK